jgi:hypothetical protein
MSVRCTKPPTVRFTQIRNEWARDGRLGYKARGLLLYLHSHSDGYELSLAQIIRDSTDGKHAVHTGLGELEEAGYLTRLRGRDDDGRWGEVDYVLADPFDTEGRIISSLPAKDQQETRQSGLSAADNPQRVIRSIEDNRENTTGEHQPPPTPRRGAVEAEELFDAFWKEYPKKVGKDAARRAWAKALKRTDAHKIIDVVERYPFDHARLRYEKDPATWLNAGCWEDDLEAVTAARQAPRGASGRTQWEPRERGTYTDAGDGVF